VHKATCDIDKLPSVRGLKRVPEFTSLTRSSPSEDDYNEIHGVMVIQFKQGKNALKTVQSPGGMELRTKKREVTLGTVIVG
jgi:hypothetical protein